MKDTNMIPVRKDRPERQITRVPFAAPLPKRKKVAAYARVSAEKDASLHSLAAQISYYKGLIQGRAEWEYAGVYADEGLTGTRANRPEFQRLLTDCRAGKIDMVIVKSISRMSRNTLTTLLTVRELKELGIDVLFEEENIHSMGGDGELLLTILASYAQEESLSVSENCKWRIREKFRAGEINGFSMYGYDVKKGNMTIREDEAETVRRIFRLYLEGMGREKIANMLNREHVPAPRGGRWHSHEVLQILQNEKYAGELLLQKTFVADHLSKKQVMNRGELGKVHVRGSHDPIIQKEIYEQVQTEIQRRRERYAHQQWETTGSAVDQPYGVGNGNRHLFSGKLTCGICGKHFKRKSGNSGKYARPVWICKTYLTGRKEMCPSRRIAERVLVSIVADALGVNPERLPEEIDRVGDITVFPEGRLLIEADGSITEHAWHNPSRSESWTDDMREKAAADARRRGNP